MSVVKLRELEARVARLEAALAQVQAALEKQSVPERPWWERISGSQEGDPVFEEIVRLGRKIRRADRPPATTKRNSAAASKARASRPTPAKE